MENTVVASKWETFAKLIPLMHSVLPHSKYIFKLNQNELLFARLRDSMHQI